MRIKDKYTDSQIKFHSFKIKRLKNLQDIYRTHLLELILRKNPRDCGH